MYIYRSLFLFYVIFLLIVIFAIRELQINNIVYEEAQCNTTTGYSRVI
jgi:hypothetical protein